MAHAGRSSMRATVAALSREGALPFALFRGVLPAYYLRQGPHVLLCLPLMEQLRLALEEDIPIVPYF